MKVSAIIVTRGDVELAPVLDSLPPSWERVVWDNGAGEVRTPQGVVDVPDLAVFGRYAAIRYARHPLIYVQDDDAIVSDPAGFPWAYSQATLPHDETLLVANMPERFRPHYPDSALVGFGALFHRDAPQRAFDRLMNHPAAVLQALERDLITADLDPKQTNPIGDAFFRRTCDVIFTALTPRRVLVDIPHTDREFASDDYRMWRQPTHVGERSRMLELCRAALA